MLIAIIISFTLIFILSTPFGILPPLGSFLLPGNGVWKVPQEIPKYEELTVLDLTYDVHIFRDEWGIPHIYGEDLADLTFALGYVHAQDRWFQMDMMRRSARGLLSEILGPDSLEQDKFQKMKLEEYWANETLKEIQTSSDPDVQEVNRILQMYTKGVNTYLREHPEKPLEHYLLGAKIRPWEELDTISLVKFLSEYFTWRYYDMIVYRNARALGKDNYQELFGFPFPYQIPVTPNYGQYDDISLPISVNNSSPANFKLSSDLPDQGLLQAVDQLLTKFEKFSKGQEWFEWNSFGSIGSNNWVISGNKTATGSAMLATDMHLGWTLPGLWYEVHLVDTSSDFNMYGLSLPGLFSPIDGNTRYVGWAHTIAMFDILDWYFYNGINETHYYYKGQPTKYETIEVEIPVKGKNPVKFLINSTVHGPVFTGLVPEIDVDSSSNIVIASRWIAQDITKDYLAIWGAIKAKDVYEFDEAQRYLEMLPLNIAFADIHGNIGIRPNAKVPIRNDTGIPEWHLGGGKMPYNGSAGEGEWIGYIDYNDLPHEINPKQGYLVSANQVIAGPDYPNVSVINMAGTDDGYRARRLNYLLASHNQITIEDIKSFQNDVYSVRAGNFTPFLLDAMDSISSLSSIQLAIKETLQDWSFIMDKDEVAPTIFNIWAEVFRYLTFNDEMNAYNFSYEPSWAVLEKLTRENENSKWFNDINTENVETRDEIILSALSLTLEALKRYFETDDISQWTWGSIHQYSFDHFSQMSALSAGPFPGDGTGYTVSPSGTNHFNGSHIRKSFARSGASERIIIDFSNFNNSFSVIPSGQRGVSTSKHYSDQLEILFLNGDYHQQYFNADTPYKIQRWAKIESMIYFKAGGP